MMEKSRKKMVVKDGKVVGRQKAQRKDKGVRLFVNNFILFVINLIFFYRKLGTQLTCCGPSRQEKML